MKTKKKYMKKYLHIILSVVVAVIDTAYRLASGIRCFIPNNERAEYPRISITPDGN